MAKQNNNTEASGDFINPFSPATYKFENEVSVCVPGPSLEEFKAALNGKSISEYFEGKIMIKADESEQDRKDAVQWLEKELKAMAYNADHKDELLAKSRKEDAVLQKINNAKIN